MTCHHHKKVFLTVQADHFDVTQGKLVASPTLWSGEWKLRVKPEFHVNKHRLGQPLRGAVMKVNTAYLNMKIQFGFTPHTHKKNTEQKKWLTSVDAKNWNQPSDPVVGAILVLDIKREERAVN